jgi:hypothetical protein
MLFRFNERLVDPSLRPPGSRLVEVLAAAYPVELGRSTSPVRDAPVPPEDAAS